MNSVDLYGKKMNSDDCERDEVSIRSALWGIVIGVPGFLDILRETRENKTLEDSWKIKSSQRLKDTHHGYGEWLVKYPQVHLNELNKGHRIAKQDNYQA